MTRYRARLLAKAFLEKVLEGPPLFLFVALGVGLGVAGAANAYLAAVAAPVAEHASAAADAGRPAPRALASTEAAKEKETPERLLHRQHGSTVPRRAPARGHGRR
jgi:hypothetical protein